MVKNIVESEEKVFWVVGKNYVIRTVTMIQIGTLVDISEHEVILKDAAWVADAGRWATFLKEGKVNEVEPFPDGLIAVGRHAIIDSCVWNHALLRDQK